MSNPHPKFRKAYKRALRDIKTDGFAKQQTKMQRRASVKARNSLDNKKRGDFLLKGSKAVNKPHKRNKSRADAINHSWQGRPSKEDVNNAKLLYREHGKTPKKDYKEFTSSKDESNYWKRGENIATKSYKRKKAAANKLEKFNRGRKIKAV